MGFLPFAMLVLIEQYIVTHMHGQQAKLKCNLART